MASISPFDDIYAQFLKELQNSSLAESLDDKCVKLDAQYLKIRKVVNDFHKMMEAVKNTAARMEAQRDEMSEKLETVIKQNADLRRTLIEVFT